MSLMRNIALVAAAFAALEARAETINCQARVALNRVYHATFDTATGETLVTNDAGTEIRGQANVTVSGRTGNTILFVGTGFTSGVSIEVESGGSQRVALCLAANECYLCRR